MILIILFTINIFDYFAIRAVGKLECFIWGGYEDFGRVANKYILIKLNFILY